MNRLLFSLTAVSVLNGCVIVPYDAAPVTYYDGYAPLYLHPYAVAPATVYGPPMYVGPPVHFGFGLNYYGGSGHHHHLHGSGQGHGFGGWHRGWRH
jgi:hypothetical protein